MIHTISQLASAITFAEDAHTSTNHYYNGLPYFEGHIKPVIEVCKRFIHLAPADKHETVLAAAALHDVIEDCRVTYNSIKEVTNKEVAEIVYAVTNEKGRYRKERANLRYYSGIRNTEYALFVKLADRIANIEASINGKGADKLNMYRKEQLEFSEFLGWDGDLNRPYAEMWLHLESLLK